MERLHTWGPGPNSSLQRLYRCAAKTSCSSWISAVRSRRPAAADRNGNAASGRLPGRLGLFTTCQLIGSCRGVARRRRDASRSGIRHARHGHFVRARKRWLMAAVMIGVDPHKSSHRGGDRACRGASGRVAGRCVARLVGGSQAGIEGVYVSHRSSPLSDLAERSFASSLGGAAGGRLVRRARPGRGVRARVAGLMHCPACAF